MKRGREMTDDEFVDWFLKEEVPLLCSFLVPAAVGDIDSDVYMCSRPAVGHSERGGSRCREHLLRGES